MDGTGIGKGISVSKNIQSRTIWSDSEKVFLPNA